MAAALGIGVAGVYNNNCLGVNAQSYDNLLESSFTSNYNFGMESGTPFVTFRDQIAMTVAQLPTNWCDGWTAYCSDGRATNVGGGNLTLIGGGRALLPSACAAPG